MHGLTTPPTHANISQASGATDEGVIRKVVRQQSQGVVGSTHFTKMKMRRKFAHQMFYDLYRHDRTHMLAEQ